MKIKSGISMILASAVLVFGAYGIVEPRISGAQFDDDEILVNQDVNTGISISSPSDVNLTALGTGVNSAVGSAVWTVITNNNAGYSLTVEAGAAPAMVRSGGGGNIADYTEASAGVPETWNVPSGNVEFGFSARGSDVNTGTWGTDSDCIAAADVPSATLNWLGFDGTTPIAIASSGTITTTTGTATEVCFATEQDTIFAASGNYTATITATATAL